MGENGFTVLCWFLLCNNVNQLSVYIYLLSLKPPSPSFQASLVAQMVKNLLAMWETWVQSLVWEDSLEKGMAAHFSILAWRISWTEDTEVWQATVHGVAKSQPQLNN